MAHFSLPVSSFSCSCCYSLVSGIKFKPTEKELLHYFLARKIHGLQLPCNAVIEKDVYACEPWLFQDPNSGDEKYYFVRRERKSESINGKNSKRSLKATGNAKGGWWKATIGDQMIFNKKHHVIGYKKTLKFCMYKSDKRNRDECIKTDWIMHEYRLPSSTFQEWVICGIKNNGLKRMEDTQNVSQESIVTLQPTAQHGSQLISQYDSNDDDFEDFAGRLENELQYQEEYNEDNNNALTTSTFQEQTHYNDSVESMNMMWYDQDRQVQESIATQPILQHNDQYNISRESVALQQISQLDPNDDFEDFISSLENELRCH